MNRARYKKICDTRVHTLPSSLPWHWLPPLLTLSLVLTLHIDAPYYDQWDLLPLLHAHYQGTLQWQDLLQPHNGHILLLPKMVMLGLAILTHWNTLAEVLFSFLCMLLNWCLLQKMAGTLLNRALSMPEKCAVSLLVFSLSQAENWLWGWQLQIPLALLFILSGFCALLYVRHTLLSLVIATACGVAATCSFAGSLPFWIAAMPLLWQRQRTLLIPWCLITGASLFSYANFISAPQYPSLVLDAMHPTELLHHARNTLAVLGNLAGRFHMVAAISMGFTATIIIAMYMAAINIPNTQSGTLTSKQKHLAMAMFLFSAGSALLVSLSRSGLGDEQMLASRYSTLTLPFWVAAAILLILRIQEYKKPQLRILGVILLVSLLASETYSIRDFQKLHNRLQRGSAALNNMDNTREKTQIGVINPRKDSAQALQEARLLQQYQLSTYRESAP